MASTDNDKLAVLIDADNAQASVIHELLEEVAAYGTATVKRAYGDWTTSSLKGWKDVLHKLAILPVQQFAYTRGKNATDSAMIIDAMDLLHTGNLDGFCLVSSDSDFTTLASRLREAGLVVYDFGERKTPEAFVAACHKFIYTDILKPTKAASGKSSPKAPPLKPQLIKAVEAAAEDDGWARLGRVGSILNENNRAFDPRNYGCKKLGDLVRKQGYLNIQETPGAAGSHTEIMVSLK